MIGGDKFYMDFILKYLQSKMILFIVIAILGLTNVFSICYFLNRSESIEECVCEECPLAEIEEETKEESSKIKVDIKGYVKKPGVYEVEEGTIINDLLKLAGGLKTNGTTENINLSKRLNNEDMIVVLSKTELKKQKATTISSTSSTSQSKDTNSSLVEPTNKKVSINTATKEELMTLNGIGEAKAIAILEYRAKTPFQAIEDIKNISGIGESVYEKIKDYITI